ncbi:MAG: hypothetical protein RBT76_04270 [candidate division Zixibacteria bacterium]|nr:hypothetical protein [candidate division Zixibacteria bacterium]
MDGLEKLEHNGIETYIEAGLKEFLKQFDEISIDHVTIGGRTGFVVRVGAGCDSGSCSSGTCG